MPDTPNTRLRALQSARVSSWLDTLSRELLHSGAFAELVRKYGVTGATSNPTIFAKAITGSDRYDSQLRQLAESGEHDLQHLFFTLALDDIRDAARELRAVYEQSGGRDGFISFECTPDLADDNEATISQALDLWHRPEQTLRAFADNGEVKRTLTQTPPRRKQRSLTPALQGSTLAP